MNYKIRTMLFFFFLSIQSTCWAAQKEILAYTNASIEALSEINFAYLAYISLSPIANPNESFFSSLLIHSNLSKSFSIAMAKIEPFTNSKDQEIARASALFVSTLQKLEDICTKIELANEQILSNPSDTLDLSKGKISDFVQLQEEWRQNWKAYEQTVGLFIVLPLIDTTKPQRPLERHIKLNQAELEMMKLHLRTKMRSSPHLRAVQLTKGNNFEGIVSNRPLTPLEILWEFLHQPTFKF